MNSLVEQASIRYMTDVYNVIFMNKDIEDITKDDIIHNRIYVIFNIVDDNLIVYILESRFNNVERFSYLGTINEDIDIKPKRKFNSLSFIYNNINYYDIFNVSEDISYSLSPQEIMIYSTLWFIEYRITHMFRNTFWIQEELRQLYIQDHDHKESFLLEQKDIYTLRLKIMLMNIHYNEHRSLLRSKIEGLLSLYNAHKDDNVLSWISMIEDDLAKYENIFNLY